MKTQSNKLAKASDNLLFWSRVNDQSETPTNSDIQNLLDAQQQVQEVLRAIGFRFTPMTT